MRNSPQNKSRLIGLITLIACLAFGLGALQSGLAQNARNSVVESFLSTPAGQAFMEAYGSIQRDYLDDNVDDSVIIRGALDGMLEALDDPYTSYLEPKDADRDRQDRSGSFEGIGATISAINRKDQTLIEIVNPYKDSPAWNNGLQRGDIFIEVDGVNVEEMDIFDVVDRIRGPKGSTANLLMRRAGEDELLEFNVVRDRIEIISVESTVLPENVGYVAVSTFSNEKVYTQLKEQLDALEEQGITSLILDLRDNGGGLLSQGIVMADEFLGEGSIVFQRSRGVTRRLATADKAMFDLPMVVLVNKNSASASEIVAGALQDHGRALVVGEETFGKGVGQTVTPLSDDGQLVLLNFEWLTPDRRSINKTGIQPDVKVKDSRRPSFINFEGQGAEEGQEIEIIIDGVSAGMATINEDGSFDFFQAVERRDRSPVQGEALVSIDTDSALKVAHETVLKEAAKSN